MVTSAAVYTRIEAPPLVPRPYGLFSVAPPIDGAERWRVGVGMQSTHCMEAEAWQDACIAGGAGGAKPPTDWSCAVTVADPFTVVILAQRTGIDVGVAQAETSGALEAAEEYAVEKHLWAQMEADAIDLGSMPMGDGYTLGVVEGNLARGYRGRGVIHLSPMAATMLAPLLESTPSGLITKGNGTPVVVGAGYGSATDPTAQIIGTGALVIRRGELTELTSWSTAVNDIFALAERDYLTAWDCFAAKATATVT
jgi:hypothetical protein